MATAELTKPKAAFSIAPITFEATKEALEQLVGETSLLTVSGIDDKNGIATVREKRLEYKRLRISIEKRREELKAESLKYGQEVDGMARALTAIIQPEEKRLQHEEDIVKREQERLAKEAAEHREKMIRARLEMLSQLSYPGCQVYIVADVDLRDPKDWESLLANAREKKAAYDKQEAERKAESDRIAEQQRLEAEKLANERAEFERRQAEEKQRRDAVLFSMQQLLEADPLSPMTFGEVEAMSEEQFKAKLIELKARKRRRDDDAKAEQARLDAQRKEQEAAQEKIDAENKRLADEAAERERKAAERARVERMSKRCDVLQGIVLREFSVDDIEPLFKEAGLPKTGTEIGDATDREFNDMVSAVTVAVASRKLEETQRAEADERERQRLESLKPDHEKLLAVADAIQAIVVPEVSPEAEPIRQQIVDSIRYAANDVRGFAGELVRQS